mmetsp:Transcript_25295/g.59207  ORF Transcript_25295/g.59207 Transcript_25295/m.59207 type:complete len:204 (-) Transcript_25295:574-1185(-)
MMANRKSRITTTNQNPYFSISRVKNVTSCLPTWLRRRFSVFSRCDESRPWAFQNSKISGTAAGKSWMRSSSSSASSDAMTCPESLPTLPTRNDRIPIVRATRMFLVLSSKNRTVSGSSTFAMSRAAWKASAECLVARLQLFTSMMSTKRSSIPSAFRQRSAWCRTLAVKMYFGIDGSIPSSSSRSSPSVDRCSATGMSWTSLR